MPAGLATAIRFASLLAMTQDTPPLTLIAISPGRRGRVLHVCAPDGDCKSWRLPRRAADADLDGAMGEVLAACGQGPVACLEAEAFSELASRPNVLPAARPVLGNLWDLREAALLFLPTEAAHAAGAGVEDRPSRDGLPDDLAHTLAVHERVRAAVREMPQELLAALGPLLADEPAYRWVPWPVGAGEMTNLLQIGKVLPRRPPPARPRPAAEDIEGDLLDAAGGALSPGGPVETALEAYEHRPGQVEMAAAVAEALREEKLLLVEAGTGVGKSLAYLVPAIIHARRTGEPVVVSTNTKNLQEQLLCKDLPLLRQALPFEFEAAVVKGRSNYPCIRALVSAAVDAANGLFRGERIAAVYLISWLAHSRRGDLEDVRPEALAAFGELGPLIARVRSQGEACLGRACSHCDCCPVEVARAVARRAHIVVSNHALTFADTRASVLPRYRCLIFDEAQNIETVATEQLSLECSNFSYGQMLRALAGEPSSFVEVMGRRLQEVSDPAGLAAKDALAQVTPLAEAFDAAVGVFGDTLYEFVFLTSDRGWERGERATVRLVEQVRATAEWQEAAALGGAVLEQGAALLSAVEAFGAKLAEMDKGAQVGAEGLDSDAEAMRVRIAAGLDSLRAVMEARGDRGEYVTWAEAWRARRGQAWSLHAAPVDIGHVLDETLYQHKSAIVLTSATITVDGRFDYARGRLGLDKHAERLMEVGVPSPFDLERQLLLCVPGDLPDPAQAGFNDAVTDALARICEVTEGGTLALFTARTRMTQAFERLREPLAERELTLLCQDVSGPRPALLERLKTDPRAVLLGLKSFWEGVDVPGAALRCVVICKLPFAVPDDPIIAARQEDVAARGGDPMHDYYIPEAIVGFKQGFGRLIRSTTDRGVVFVLDRRIVTKGYGRRFFRSIQRCALSREPMEECLGRAREWLG